MYRPAIPLLFLPLLVACGGSMLSGRDSGEAGPPPPVCELERCAALMARARDWLVDNTHFPVMTESDTYVATERDAVPTSQRIWGTLELQRVDATHSRVVLNFRCNNPVRCREDVRELRARAYADLSRPARVPRLEDIAE